MKKPLKVLSSSALVAALAVSSLTPVAVSANETTANYTVQDVVFQDGDMLAKILLTDYSEALVFGDVSDDPVHVIYPNGNMYKLEDYTEELTFSDDPQAVYEALAGKEVKQDVYEGYIDEDGKVKAKVDEQPEDRLNETFFYNVA